MFARKLAELFAQTGKSLVEEMVMFGGDVANGNVQKITLNSALTINGFTNPVAGQTLTIIIYGGVGYSSITSTMKFANNDRLLTNSGGCIDFLSIFYDGTTYFASLNRGFA